MSPSISDTLAVDPGPTAGNAHLYLSPGQRIDLTSLLLALDTPGLPGDSLMLSAVGTAGTKGTVSLSNGDLTYTAPASGSSDAFTYTVSDQLHETAIGSVSVSLSKNGNIVLTGSANTIVSGDGNYSISGGTGGNSITLGKGNDNVSVAGNNNTVVLGGGNDTVSLPGSNNTATLGDGNDNVTAGDGSKISLGKGNDTVSAGANSTIILGNGNDSVSVGSGSSITLGSGNDAITLVGGSVTLGFGAQMGKDVVTGFQTSNDVIQFNHALFANYAAVLGAESFDGHSTTITDPTNHNESLTLVNLAPSSLHTSNFSFN